MVKKKFRLNKFLIAMLIFIPISAFFGLYVHDLVMTFITAAIALIPLAIIIGQATKEIALQTNPTIGGLFSATFGNIIELLLAIFALQRGLIQVVQATIIGSLIGNILLLIGLSVFFGGLKYKHQYFNKQATGVSATMLIIAVIGLTMPTMYALTNSASVHINMLSDIVAFFMAMIYLAGLLFSLKTHKDLFDASDEMKARHEKPTMKLKNAIFILLIATVFVALESELLVKGLEVAAFKMGITEMFVGVVILAMISNIAEEVAAITFARENKLDISLEIGMSSAIQIALFVVPILVLISQVFNYGFNLVFSFFEMISLILAVMIINYLSSDGKCNWLEGAQLIIVYMIIVTAFLFM